MQLSAGVADVLGATVPSVVPQAVATVRIADDGVAFGCARAEVDNHMHGVDEFAEISQLILSAKIFAQAIIDLCGEKE